MEAENGQQIKDAFMKITLAKPVSQDSKDKMQQLKQKKFGNAGGYHKGGPGMGSSTSFLMPSLLKDNLPDFYKDLFSPEKNLALFTPLILSTGPELDGIVQISKTRFLILCSSSFSRQNVGIMLNKRNVLHS